MIKKIKINFTRFLGSIKNYFPFQIKNNNLPFAFQIKNNNLPFAIWPYFSLIGQNFQHFEPQWPIELGPNLLSILFYIFLIIFFVNIFIAHYKNSSFFNSFWWSKPISNLLILVIPRRFFNSFKDYLDYDSINKLDSANLPTKQAHTQNEPSLPVIYTALSPRPLVDHLTNTIWDKNPRPSHGYLETTPLEKSPAPILPRNAKNLSWNNSDCSSDSSELNEVQKDKVFDKKKDSKANTEANVANTYSNDDLTSKLKYKDKDIEELEKMSSAKSVGSPYLIGLYINNTKIYIKNIKKWIQTIKEKMNIFILLYPREILIFIRLFISFCVITWNYLNPFYFACIVFGIFFYYYLLILAKFVSGKRKPLLSYYNNKYLAFIQSNQSSGKFKAVFWLRLLLVPSICARGFSGKIEPGIEDDISTLSEGINDLNNTTNELPTSNPQPQAPAQASAPASLPETSRGGAPASLPETSREGAPASLPETSREGAPASLPETSREGAPASLPETSREGSPIPVENDNEDEEMTLTPRGNDELSLPSSSTETPSISSEGSAEGSDAEVGEETEPAVGEDVSDFYDECVDKYKRQYGSNQTKILDWIIKKQQAEDAMDTDSEEEDAMDIDSDDVEEGTSKKTEQKKKK